MKLKFRFILLLLVACNLFCGITLTPKIYFGTNFSRNDYSDNFKVEKHCYHPGFIFGFSNQIKLNNTFFIQNDIYYDYQHSKTLLGNHGLWGSIYHNYFVNYLRVSVLFGYRLPKQFYLLCGPDIGKIIGDVRLKLTHDFHTFEEYSENVTNIFPAYDISLCIGFGKEIQIKNKSFQCEIKYYISFTDYNFKSNWSGLKEDYINHRLSLIFGFLI